MNLDMEASYGAESSQSKVVVLLLGEKQSGKSSAGNVILGKPAFHKKTTYSSSKNGTVFGIQVTVVDTPGWISHSTTPDRVSKEICRGLTLCRPEPHVILLVLPTSSTFGQEEWRAMEAQLQLLHTPIWQRAIVLFTHGDKLGGLPIQEHISRQGWALNFLLERCGNRYQVMTNQSGASEAQVTELLRKIQKMMVVNRHPRELQYRMYTELRRDLSIKVETRWHGRQEDIEMRVMQDVHDGRPRESVQVASRWLHMPRAISSEPVGFKPALGLVLLGRRKSGKSSVGNVILDRGEFQIDKKTIRCSVGHGQLSGWSVTVVDTPGWSLFGLGNPEQVKMEISRSPSLCPPQSKVYFLLAVPVGSFKEKDRKAVEMYLNILEANMWRSTVVVFTYGDKLRGRTVEKHIKDKGEPLQWVLDRCGRRHVVFDTNTADDTQVNQLLQIVEQL